MKLTFLCVAILLFLSFVSMETKTEEKEDDQEIDYSSLIGSAIKKHIERHAHKIYNNHVPSVKETVDFWMGSEEEGEDITIELSEDSHTKKKQGGSKHYIALIVLLIALLLMLALLLCFCSMIQRVAIYVVWLLMIMVIIFLFITLGAFVSMQYDWFSNTAFYGSSP